MGGFRCDQNFTQADEFGLRHLVLVSVVELLFFFFRDGEMAADLFADHFLSDDLVAHVLLEVFPGDALLGGFLFKVFEGLKLHVFAHLVKTLDQIRVAGNAQIFSLVQEELLIDEVAQNVFFAFGKFLVGVVGILLFDFVAELIFAAIVFGTRDDLVVDARNDLFDDLSAG